MITTEGAKLRLAVGLAMRHMEPGHPVELRLAALGKPHRAAWKHPSETVRRANRHYPSRVYRTHQAGVCTFQMERTV